MLCPHCGFENVEGRKYCRGCAKALAPEVVAARSTPQAQSVPPLAVTPSAPTINRMAVASFGLSFLGFIPPVGIASVVLGHISRKQIAASQGRQTGTGLAFTALILSYGQLFLVALIFCLVVAIAHELNAKMGGDRYFRAALLERIMNGDPNHPSAAVMAKNGSNLMDALHLIQARQDAYQAENGNVACQLIYLEAAGREDELSVHVRNSHYSVQIVCRGLDSSGHVTQYAVTAFPITEANPPNVPVYCFDETKTIRRYSDANEITGSVFYRHLPCPEDGQPVE